MASGAVFTPGYTRAEAEPDPRGVGPAAGQADPGGRAPSGGRYGSPASGTAGRGPVRGYAPVPGQPPPIYPPGQFAAWNRRRDGQPGRAAQPGGEDGQPVGTGPAGIEHAQPPRAAGVAERYYAADADPGNQPGYPVLAVSDPAADVTSTQTWRAVADGRSTGIWTAPPGLREEIPSTAAPDGAPALPGVPAAAPPGRPGTALPTRPGRHGTGSPRVGGELRTDTGSNPRISTGPGPRISTGPGPRVSAGPGPRVSTAESLPATRTERTGATGRRRAGTGTGRRLRHRSPASVKLAIAAALLLVLAAAATLAYTVLRDSPKPGLAGHSPGKPSASASPSPSTGPYGDIASRQTDPQALTLAQLYPASFTLAGNTVTSAATGLSADCAAAIVGATLQSAAGAAGCTQVARATYVETPAGIMATIGVLNLSTGDAAKTAAQSADANDFISQLTASSGPAQKIGQGTGIEEALAKGHYLILVWAELTGLQTPTAQQSTSIETFMTQLVQGTANKDLTTRMLTGTP
ncbi:MAG: hypothetical protein ACRDOK_00300 [Streptosporangiaceae bacterium]